MFARKNIVILLSLFALSVDIFPLENRSKTAPRGSVVATKKLKKDSKKNS